jgi:hypothetical protein
LVFDTFEETPHNMWFATADGGVIKFDGKSFTNLTRTNGLADNSVNISGIT